MHLYSQNLSSTYKCTYTNANNRAYVSIYTPNLWDLNAGSKYIINPANELDSEWLKGYMVIKYETKYDEQYNLLNPIQNTDYSRNFDGNCNVCGVETEADNYFYIDVYKGTLNSICRECIEKYNRCIYDSYIIDKYTILCGWMLKNNDAGYLAVKGMQGYLLRELSPAKYIRCLKYKKLHISNNYHQYSKCIYCDNKLKKARIESHSLCEDCDAFLHDYCISIANKTYWLIDYLCEDNVSDIRLILISITLLKDY
jgi:hypothetical protein